MTAPLLAEFTDPAALLNAVDRVRTDGHQALDAFTPYPVDGLAQMLDVPPSRLRYAMFAGGIAAAAVAYALQWYSAVIAYPLNSGGRSLHSWQVFVLVPFEIGIFAAALAGVVAFLWSSGLPRLHYPLFEIPGFERATQDHFFLLAAPCDETVAATELRRLLKAAGAVVVTELRRP